MKKLAYSITILLAACACTKEMVSQEISKADTMTFSASFEGNVTKTSLGDGNTVIWDAEDAISVFDVGTAPTNSKCSLTEGAGTTNGTFMGETILSATGYFAVYPYTENLISLNCSSTEHPRGVLNFRSSDYSTQYARKGNIPSNIPMVAYAEAPEHGSTVALNFKNVFSYLKFTIEYRCKSVIVSSNSGNSLTPSDYSISFDSDGLPVASISLSAINTVTLMNEDGSPIEPGTYYIAVLPQTLSEGFTMAFTSAYNSAKTYSWKKEDSVELKRSHILNLMTVNVSEIADLDGQGTEENPYLIRDFYDLTTMSSLVYLDADNYASAYYRQECDINCEGKCLDPIGGKTKFSGHYNGNGKTISNLKVGETDFDGLIAYGMFGCIKNAEIKNLTISNPSFVQISATTSLNLSPLVGVAISEDGKNVIHDCHITADSSTTINISNFNYLDYGGIIAFNESELEITNCSNRLNMYFDASTQDDEDHLYLGGILGYTSGEKTSDPTHDNAENDAKTVIKCCRFTGNIKAENVHNHKTSIGGIVGMCHDSSSGDVCTEIGVCVSSGRLDAWKLEPVREESKSPYMGGIIGSMDSDGYTSGLSDHNPEITCCLVKCTFGSDSNAEDYLNLGGLAGYIYDKDTQVSYCVIAQTNETHTSDYSGYPTFGGSAFAHYVDNYWHLENLKPVDCYVTNEDWYDIDESYITYKADLTADYMNNLTNGTATWTGELADKSFDLSF